MNSEMLMGPNRDGAENALNDELIWNTFDVAVKFCGYLFVRLVFPFERHDSSGTNSRTYVMNWSNKLRQRYLVRQWDDQIERRWPDRRHICCPLALCDIITMTTTLTNDHCRSRVHHDDWPLVGAAYTLHRRRLTAAYSAVCEQKQQQQHREACCVHGSPAYAATSSINKRISCNNVWIFLNVTPVLRATVATAVVRLSHRNSVVCLSHRWISQKRCKLGSPNLQSAAWKILVSESVKLFHHFERGHPEQGR